MGLPEIIIEFRHKASTAIARSERGIVAVILRDDTKGATQYTYRKLSEVDFSQWSERNYEYLKLIFEGGPYKVIALRIAADAADYSAPLAVLEHLKWNYLTIPGIEPTDTATITSWIKERRDAGKDKKTFKAVLPNCAADHEGVINLTTTSITSTLSESPITAAEYCARIAGVLAGLPLTRSATYYVLEDIVDCAVPSNPDDRIDGGELVIVFDSEKYKIGRGVNSLTTISDGKTADMKKIKIIEGMDLYNDDICTTFADNYVGKRINDYDSKQAFVAAILSYQKGITGDVLDSSYDNTVSIDLDAQRAYLDGKGIDTADMDDVAIARANTGSKVFVASDIKFVDAMEDLHLTTNM